MSRALKFLPLTFVCGTWGFNLFIPYMLVVMAAAIAGARRLPSKTLMVAVNPA
jgi:hypothetical protein